MYKTQLYSKQQSEHNKDRTTLVTVIKELKFHKHISAVVVSVNQ